jgi:phosphoglucosamine mutase
MEIAKKFFGTDGIRGKAGDYPLTKEFIQKLAFAAAEIFHNKDVEHIQKVIIGTDTRESCFWIFEALCQGLNKLGLEVDYAGVVSTPCLSVFTKLVNNYSFGIMISASHNPYHDNGIKFFSNTGEKLSDNIEKEIEQEILNLQDFKIETNKECVYNDVSNDTYDFYKKFLFNTLNKDFRLDGFKVILDCANGSLFHIGPKIFKDLGSEVISIGKDPDGKNINQNCGSTHTDVLVDLVKKNDCDIAFAFDGDGDRVIGIRKDGKILHGDFLMGILAKYLKDNDELKNNCLVLTVMSNLGLKIFLHDEKIDYIETKVGDRYVYESLKETGSIIGGEQSGHIILKNYNNTGDGLLVALHIVQILKDIGTEEFNKISDNIEILPQILVNVRLKEKKDIFSDSGIKKEYQKIENILGDNGRILVRYSGTEPLLRIMIEGKDKAQITKMADDFAKEVEGAFL